MLLEVNALKYLIVDRPSRDDVDLWSSAAAKAALALLVDLEDSGWWTDRLSDAAVVVVRSTNFTNDVTANIMQAIGLLGARLYETAFVTSDPYAVSEAANTRVGTILLAEGVIETIADIVLDPTEQDKNLVLDVASGRHLGLLHELSAVRYGEMRRATGSGFYFSQKLLKNRPEIDERVRKNVEVIVAGRYFPAKEARHTKHQLSMRLLHFKNGDRRGRAVMESLSALIPLVLDAHESTLITAVPPRPSKAENHLGVWLAKAVEAASRKHEHLKGILDLDAVRCIREYAPQKTAGGWDNRARNVRGAFVADPEIVRGKRVLLVDDILTSGATISEVAATLFRAGATGVMMCPIAIDQSTINYSAAEELQCPVAGCGGIISLRFPAGGDKAFWGCSAWAGGRGCNITMSYEDGIRARNELNTGEEVVLYDAGPF